MVNEVHNNPTDIGITRFLTQGTVLIRNNFFSAIIPSDRILKTKGIAKYYPIPDSTRNKQMFYDPCEELLRSENINSGYLRARYTFTDKISITHQLLLSFR
jgi:hypothetical protein